MFHRVSKFVFLFAFLCVSIPATAAEPQLLVKNHQPEAAIVVGPQPTEFQRWTAGELRRYVKELSGAELPIVASNKTPAKKPLIAVGGPQSNPLAAQAQEKQLVDFNSGIWPSESYLPPIDAATRDIIVEYAEARKLIPAVEEICQAGFTRPKSSNHLDSDIVQLGVADKIIRRLKARHPRAKLCMAMLFRAYLFRAMDAMLPKDVLFMNMENYGNRKSVMRFYGGIKGRELLVWPRMDADGCELNMQLNAMLYDRDEIITGGVRHGAAGVIGQLNKQPSWTT